MEQKSKAAGKPTRLKTGWELDQIQMAKVMGNQAAIQNEAAAIDGNSQEIIQRQVIVNGTIAKWGENGTTLEKAIQSIIDMGVVQAVMLEEMIFGGHVYNFSSAQQLIDFFISNSHQPLKRELYATYIRAEKKIAMQGTRAGDYAEAERLTGVVRGSGETWHHVEDFSGGKCTMVLIPTDIHSQFPHYGAVCQWRVANDGKSYP